MNKHRFKPMTFGTPEGAKKSDWCSYTETSFEEIKTEEDLKAAVCGKADEDPIHWVTEDFKRLYDELYDLEHDSSGYESVAERIEEIKQEIATLEGKS